MLTVKPSPHFERDIKVLKKKRRDMSVLRQVIEFLIEKKTLPAKYKDHALSGVFQGYRELHVSWNPDWLLIYEITADELLLIRTGSHDELFR